jgi:Protein of unknown function (DUF642)
MKIKGLVSIAGVATLAAFAVALTIPISAMAGPFGDGNFETPSVTGAFTTITGPAMIGPWVVNGSVNLGKGPAATTCSTANGQCVDLNGDSPGGITQTFDVACTYRVDFFMSRHMQLASSSASLEAFVNTVSKGVFTHDAPRITPTDGKWKKFSFNFVVGAQPTVLKFQSKVMTGAAGPQIDNVTVTLVSCI